MENSLKIWETIKQKFSKITTRNDESLDNKKEATENSDEKTSHSPPQKQTQTFNENGTMDIPEVIAKSIKMERLNDISLSENRNTPVQKLIQHQCHKAKKIKG